ncbi:molybdopterin converting factor subunit 1 [Deinococcus sp.]|uniref:molybdopterin converting factor subunit 1 n=1 Tax=Deinococcus sp. TaxID=47478 RepID=UPI0025F5001A|nr:molybdopterin converting factor subunit 1 [Deinococcus sp.]
MNVRVVFFARLKRELGTDSLSLELPDGATVCQAAAQIEALHGLPLSGCMAAVNEEYAEPDQPLSDNDELAFLPPVSGGGHPDDTHPGDTHPGNTHSGNTQGDPADVFEVTQEPLSLERASQHLALPQYGAQAYFVGTVRSPNGGRLVEFIDYEGYAPMAVKVMRAAAERARARHGRLCVYVQHRTGRLTPGEASIVIGVGSPHRRAALEACDELIEELKVELPIWKHEGDDTGAHWVEGSVGHTPL